MTAATAAHPDPALLAAAGVDPAAAEALCRRGRPFTAEAGATLFRPGDVCPGFIVPSQGLIRVSLLAASGRAATLYRVAPGQMCVQTFQRLVDGEPYSAEGTVEQDIVGVLAPPSAFERLMGESPAFRAMVLRQVAERFEHILRSFEDTAFRPLEARLAQGLLRVAKGDRVDATHAGLAAEIGSSREVVSRQMHRWVESGLIRAERGHVELLRPDALRVLAGRSG